MATYHMDDSEAFTSDDPRGPVGPDDYEAMDAEIATRYPCRKCGGARVYEADYRNGRYTPRAVCGECGWEEAL